MYRDIWIKEIKCSANDVLGLCHLPGYSEDVCEHTFTNWSRLVYHLLMCEEFLKKKISEELYSAMTIVSAE